MSKKEKIKNKSFEEIKALFENKSYYVRSKFLEEYHFKDDFQDYYIDFIAQNAFSIKNYSYLSDLVSFTIDFNIFHPVIIDTWYKLLKKSSSTVVLLCILDYFNACPSQDLPSDYSSTLLKLSKKHLRKILKNQFYLNLLSFDETSNSYKILLLNSLKKTKDPLSLLRTISNTRILNSKRLISEIKEEIKSLNLNFLDAKDRELIVKKASE